MSRFTVSILAAFAAAILSFAGLQFFQQSRAREVTRLHAENKRLRQEAGQRYRAQVSPSADRAIAPAVAVESTRSPEKTRPLHVSESDYRNEGQSSPVATLQTFAWACDRGDSETIRQLLGFEAAGRAKAEAFMATLPPDARARWTSPEAMAAELLTHQGMQQPFPVADVLERAVPESMPDGRIKLRLPGTPRDGTVYQKIGDRWHYVVTEVAVDRYIAQAAQRKAPAR